MGDGTQLPNALDAILKDSGALMPNSLLGTVRGVSLSQRPVRNVAAHFLQPCLAGTVRVLAAGQANGLRSSRADWNARQP